MVAARPRGVGRIPRPKGMEHDVEVTDGTIEFELPESHYRQQGYEPEVDKLPWPGEDKPAGKG